MTSIETMTIHTLPEACEIAGVGGTVIRNSITYEVGRVGDTFGLRLAGESASTFTAIGGSWAQEGWTVVTRGDTAQTVREFFGGLASGTHVVRPRSADVYVWSSIYENDGAAPVVFRRDYGTYLALDMSGEPNDWVVCTNGADEPIVADILTQRTMRDVVRGNQRHAAQNAEIVKLRQDWRRLNDFLNEYANEQRMCPDYERRLENWNESFELLELEGRKRDFEVRVRVDASYYTTVTVSAVNQDAANDEVGGMSTDDLDVDWDNPDNVDWDIID